VYEFGSYLVEGQHEQANLRGVFPGRRYVGCDMRAGPGVDRVEDLAGLSLPDGCAKTVLCLDTLEHVFEARRAVEEMIRLLAPGGILLLAAPMDFRVHDYPGDYWRLTPSCMARLLAPLEATVVGSQGLESFPHSVFGLGCKTPVSAGFARGANRLLEGFQAWLDQQQAAASWRQRLKRHTARWFRSKGERRRIEQFNQARFALAMPARVWSAGAPLAEVSDCEPLLVGTRVDVM
jgi:SAM-dependent methyltransferase